MKAVAARLLVNFRAANKTRRPASLPVIADQFVLLATTQCAQHATRVTMQCIFYGLFFLQRMSGVRQE